jgi:hypothetical protein
MFEILIGRTPFEANEQEQFSTKEELRVYYERTKAGTWVGEWSMSPRESMHAWVHYANIQPWSTS